jgi:hypothetical protein
VFFVIGTLQSLLLCLMSEISDYGELCGSATLPEVERALKRGRKPLCFLISGDLFFLIFSQSKAMSFGTVQQYSAASEAGPCTFSSQQLCTSPVILILHMIFSKWQCLIVRGAMKVWGA